MFYKISESWKAYRFERRISKLFKKLDRVNKEFLKEKQGKYGTELWSIEHEAYHEYKQLKESIYKAMTDTLTLRARRLFIPLPDTTTEQFWETSEFYNGRLLNDEGIAELRKNIREEEKARTQFMLLVVGGLTGLLGTVAACISAFGNIFAIYLSHLPNK